MLQERERLQRPCCPFSGVWYKTVHQGGQALNGAMRYIKMGVSIQHPIGSRPKVRDSLTEALNQHVLRH